MHDETAYALTGALNTHSQVITDFGYKLTADSEARAAHTAALNSHTAAISEDIRSRERHTAALNDFTEAMNRFRRLLQDRNQPTGIVTDLFAVASKFGDSATTLADAINRS